MYPPRVTRVPSTKYSERQQLTRSDPTMPTRHASSDTQPTMSRPLKEERVCVYGGGDGRGGGETGGVGGGNGALSVLVPHG